MNILITSISTKIPLIQSIRRSLKRRQFHVKIIGADSDPHVLSRYFVDEFWEMPFLGDLTIDHFIHYCKSKKINIIFPTREGELAFFARHKLTLKEYGLFVMVSDAESLKIVQDKLLFYEYLQGKGYPAIATSTSMEQFLQKAYVVKERFGAGSKGIFLNVSKKEAATLAAKLHDPIFQPYMEGTEYSIDVYVDKNGKRKGAIVRERVLVVDGESQVTKTCRNKQLEMLAMNLAEDLEIQGHAMFQIIVDPFGNVHIVECNPRFGGASTLSVAAGLDSFYWFLLESRGESLDNYAFRRSEEELTLVRYAKDFIF